MSREERSLIDMHMSSTRMKLAIIIQLMKARLRYRMESIGSLQQILTYRSLQFLGLSWDMHRRIPILQFSGKHSLVTSPMVLKSSLINSSSLESQSGTSRMDLSCYSLMDSMEMALSIHLAESRDIFFSVTKMNSFLEMESTMTTKRSQNKPTSKQFIHRQLPTTFIY